MCSGAWRGVRKSEEGNNTFVFQLLLQHHHIVEEAHIALAVMAGIAVSTVMVIALSTESAAQ